MNKKSKRIVTLLILFVIAPMLGGAIAWNIDGRTVTHITSAVIEQDGALTPGNFCTQDKIVDGGLQCDATKWQEHRPFTTRERVENTVSAVILVLAVAIIIYGLLRRNKPEASS